MARKVCEIEHNNFVAQDEIKEAARAASVEEFDQVIEITSVYSFQDNLL